MPDSSPFRVELESFGDIEIPLIKQWSVESRYGAPYDEFSLTISTYSDGRQGDPRLADELLWEKCRVLINGRPYMVGRFESSDIGQNGAEIRLRGYDYRFELHKAEVDPEVKVKDGMTLGDVIRQASACCGIARVTSNGDAQLRNIRTGRSVSTPKPYDFKLRPLKEYAPSDRERIGPYNQRVAARHHAIVSPSLDRAELVLDQPDYAQDALWEVIRYKETGNSLGNVKSSRCSRDMRDLPTFVQYDGQKRPASPQAQALAAVARFKGGKPVPPPTGKAAMVTMEVDWPSVNIPRERAVSDRIKPTDGVKLDEGVYRPMFVRDGDSKSIEQLNAAMLRGLAERMKGMFRYSVTMKGHDQGGATFTPNTIANVYDEVCGINQRLWVESVRLSGGSGGPQAELECRLIGTYPF